MSREIITWLNCSINKRYKIILHIWCQVSKKGTNDYLGIIVHSMLPCKQLKEVRIWRSIKIMSGIALFPQAPNNGEHTKKLLTEILKI